MAIFSVREPKGRIRGPDYRSCQIITQVFSLPISCQILMDRMAYQMLVFQQVFVE